MRRLRATIICTFLIIVCAHSSGVAQYTRYIIAFKDKAGSPYSLNNPGAYLSAKALARRERFNIAVDSTDLPVTPAYLDSLRAAGAVTILNTSRWLNQVAIRTSDATALTRISQMPFVKRSAPLANRAQQVADPQEKFNELEEDAVFQDQFQQKVTTDTFSYGNSYGQVHIHEGEYLHDHGFTGKGMTIAVLDAGFRNYLTNPAFDSLRNSGHILGTWDYVSNEASVNEDHFHGANCLSIMAANMPGVLVGTAPHADYWLFRTEDAATEYPIEEQNWIAAAERADSLGVDLITSSLGYSKFDDPSFDHTYADMDGKTTMITRAADMAMKKGMIVTNSAGNEGASAWKYILAPADGDSVLTVGAVDVNGTVASFSSYGPASDGRVKPDVSSVGWGTYLVASSGLAQKGNGTSYSNPNLAGLVTCLWQAFPEFRNTEITEAVKKSASKFTNPDDRMGYGIPNFRQAFLALAQERSRRQADKILGNATIKVYPNPMTETPTVLFRATTSGRLTLRLFNAIGQQISRQVIDVTAGQVTLLKLDMPDNTPHGVYMLQYVNGDQKGSVKLVK